MFRITVDPLTSLCAAFTINDERMFRSFISYFWISLINFFPLILAVYVFPPNAPMPLYHRVNIPKIHDAIWLPRRYPKSYSLNLDWQAISTLYFLTKDQVSSLYQIVYFRVTNRFIMLGTYVLG